MPPRLIRSPFLRPLNWCPPCVVLGVPLRTMLEQQLDRIDLSSINGPMQGSGTSVIIRVDVRSVVKQQPHYVLLAAEAGGLQSSGTSVVSRICVRPRIQQQSHEFLFVVVRAGEPQRSFPTVVGHFDASPLSEQ